MEMERQETWRSKHHSKSNKPPSSAWIHNIMPVPQHTQSARLYYPLITTTTTTTTHFVLFHSHSQFSCFYSFYCCWTIMSDSTVVWLVQSILLLGGLSFSFCGCGSGCTCSCSCWLTQESDKTDRCLIRWCKTFSRARASSRTIPFSVNSFQLFFWWFNTTTRGTTITITITHGAVVIVLLLVLLSLSLSLLVLLRVLLILLVLFILLLFSHLMMITEQ